MPFTDSVLIAAEVQAEIKRQRRTQREVAAVLGIQQGPFWQRLNGVIPFRASELAKVAEYLEVPVAQFYGELAAVASGPPDNRPPNKPPAGPGPGHPGGPPPPPPANPPANPPAKTTGRAA